MTTIYELVSLAMVLASACILIAAFLAAHRIMFAAIDNYRAAQHSSGDPLVCLYCERRCIPDGHEMCDECAELADGLHTAEINRLIEGLNQ